MALVKCVECGNDVSTKAKMCLKYGAKPPKQTSFFRWLLLIMVMILVIAVIQAPKSTNNPESTTKSLEAEKKEPIRRAAPPKPSWKTVTSRDEMTGNFLAYALSPKAFPLKKMSFPYSNVTSKMAVACDNEDEWVAFTFSTAPNLLKNKIKDDCYLIQTQIKWDDDVEDVILTQNWSS